MKMKIEARTLHHNSIFLIQENPHAIALVYTQQGIVDVFSSPHPKFDDWLEVKFNMILKGKNYFSRWVGSVSSEREYTRMATEFANECAAIASGRYNQVEQVLE